MTRLRARVAVLLPSLALAVTAVASPASASPAASPATQNLGQAAAGWLARQMVGGSHFTDTFDGKTFPDQGLTIDSIFAFAATGTADNYGARAIAWLARRPPRHGRRLPDRHGRQRGGQQRPAARRRLARPAT